MVQLVPRVVKRTNFLDEVGSARDKNLLTCVICFTLNVILFYIAETHLDFLDIPLNKNSSF